MKNETAILMERISLLEIRQAQELSLLREQFHSTYENLKPLNLIKSTFHEVASSPDLKDNLLNNVIGLTTGYLSKKVLVGATHNPIKKVAGAILQFAVANVVAKHSDTIKALGEVFLRRIFENRGKKKHELIEEEINLSIVNQVKKLDF
ncbi:hypothetical protein [Emticicia sp. SJ17W-69]|uniref:hypothetical protein n=1 Tax=Emticicia sp. SJ17W-69 TaxID=3421657 RepID=UPI003EBE8BDC